MDIRLTEMLEGAKSARGTAVIIDVFRAFSLECYFFARGARRVGQAGGLTTAQQTTLDLVASAQRLQQLVKRIRFYDAGEQVRLANGAAEPCRGRNGIVRVIYEKIRVS